MLQQLKELKEKVVLRAARKKELEELEPQLETLEKELFALKIDAHNQQVDVDLLNCFSLKNLYYALSGKKEAMLEKETSEARAARQKLDAAQFQYDQISQRLDSCAKEIAALKGCESDYWALLHTAVATDPQVESILVERKAEVAVLLSDAHEAGNAALEQIYDTLKNVHNVMKWNRSIGGMGWTMAMPGYLNAVQKDIEILRKLVISFTRKLDSLPLPQDAILSHEEILTLSKAHFQELTGNIGAEQRLYEADNALHAAKDKIFSIQAAMEIARKDISDM